MTLYWCFRLDAVAVRLLYQDDILQTQTSRDLTYAIERFRAKLPVIQEWVNLPM